MEFRILGPLEVWHDGAAVPLGGLKPRALLAALLLHANEVVATDRLIDDLWGEDAPERAAAALRVNVSRLRKALAADVLATAAAGLRARVSSPASSISHRFERLVDEAGGLRDRGLAAEASERLREALALWRGPALADFAYERFARPRSRGSRRSGWRRSSCGSTPTSRSAATPSWSGSSRRWSPSTRCASGCAAS